MMGLRRIDKYERAWAPESVLPTAGRIYWLGYSHMHTPCRPDYLCDVTMLHRKDGTASITAT